MPASEPSAWADRLVLRGRRVVVCRTTEQAGGLLRSISTLGGIGIALPLLERAAPLDAGVALDRALAAIGSFDWLILTSVNAVHAVAARCPVLPESLRLAVVGPVTARAATAEGWQPAFEPSTATGEALALELPIAMHPTDRDRQRPPRVLAPLAELAADTIQRLLGERGVIVTRVDAYRMAMPRHTSEQIAAALAAEVVLLTSPSTAERFAGLARNAPLGDRQRVLPQAVVIGPSTLAAAIAAGFDVIASADPHTEDGLLAALVRSIDP